MTPFRGKLRTRHLEVVLSISEQGNLSRAAELLHMTQSGLSRALAEIEDIVEAKLFERTAKGMLATTMGVAMCRHAALLLTEMRKAEAEFESIANGDAGNLVVGCFSLFAGPQLAKAVERFMLKAPKVQIAIEVGPHETLIEKLDKGSIDLLISRGIPLTYSPAYRFIHLIDDGIVLACAPNHPLANTSASLEQCVQYPWISAPPGSIMRELLMQEILSAGVAAHKIVGVLSLELGRSLAMGGQMLWQLPCSVAQVMAAQGEIYILPLHFNLKPGPLSAIWRRDRSSTRAMRDFAVILKESLRQKA